MQINDLHPAGLPRRLRYRSRRPVGDCCDSLDEVAGRLRNDAAHIEALADIWAAPGSGGETRDDLIHVIGHYRRTARRLRDTADAIEREHATGPWVSLDQPFVHLSEARPAGKEAN